MTITTIYVCTNCKAAEDTSPERAGLRLMIALEGAISASGAKVRLEGVECLSVCKRPCTIAFSAPGKWTYVYGDFAPDSAPETILDGAALYAATDDGLIPWKQRPDTLKKGVIARLPPSVSSSKVSEITP